MKYAGTDSPGKTARFPILKTQKKKKPTQILIRGSSYFFCFFGCCRLCVDDKVSCFLIQFKAINKAERMKLFPVKRAM